ncbi:50S ribosomal protein L29 [Thermomicrobium sp. CFH 73360]|nr:50S ribosomal protein L29 [Thermomicrobium sp. CFH 73360]MCM8747268.1 50S ribosomal protein L29 [Thermomicrobium sp. CFH 73360]
MKPAELRAMTDDQLRQKLEELRNEVRDLRFAAALGQLKDTSAIRNARKDIARILTILTERERARLAEQGLLPPPKLTRRERRRRKQLELQQRKG